MRNRQEEVRQGLRGTPLIPREEFDQPDTDPEPPVRRQSDDPDYDEAEQQEAERP